MAEITVWTDAIGNIGITEHREPKSRLEWSAPGIQIYKRGLFTPGRYAAAFNLVANYCIERHIPAIAIKRECGCFSQSKKAVKPDNQLELYCDYCGESILNPFSKCLNCGATGEG